MARNVDGVTSILKAARVICRMVDRFGVVVLAARTSPEFAAAATALAAACKALEALDNVVDLIDRKVSDAGTGSFDEDLPVGVTVGSLSQEAQGN
jgi:hypothetical protein